MIKFIKTKDPDNEYDYNDIEFTIKDQDISHCKVIEVFTDFLRGIGYRIDGEYVLVKDNEEVVEIKTTAEKVLFGEEDGKDSN